MTVDKMKKEDLELLSNKDITKLILEESKKPLNTADLFKKIIKLLELPDSVFETKIGDYYTALSTDKRFILLEDGCWDLRNRHTSDKVIKSTLTDEEDDDDELEDAEDDIIVDDNVEDDYSDNDDDNYNNESDDDLKDLVVLDEEDMELEE